MFFFGLKAGKDLIKPLISPLGSINVADKNLSATL